MNFRAFRAPRVILAAVLFLVLGAGLVTFVPATAQSMACGTWVSPEWPDDDVRDLVEHLRTVADDRHALSSLDSMDPEAPGSVQIDVGIVAMCDDALSGRRMWTFLLLGGALLVLVVAAAMSGRPRNNGDEGGATPAGA